MTSTSMERCWPNGQAMITLTKRETGQHSERLYQHGGETQIDSNGKQGRRLTTTAIFRYVPAWTPGLDQDRQLQGQNRSFTALVRSNEPTRTVEMPQVPPWSSRRLTNSTNDKTFKTSGTWRSDDDPLSDCELSNPRRPAACSLTFLTTRTVQNNNVSSTEFGDVEK